MLRIKKNISLIIKQTDIEFIEELNKSILNNFNKTFDFIRNQKILFFGDFNFINNSYLLDALLKKNNIYYYVEKKKLFYNNLTDKIIKLNEINKIEFDYIITSCIAFDLNNKILLDPIIIKNIKKVRYKKIIAYAFNIQLFDLNSFDDKNIKKGTIISNNFIVK